jgi:hypothetical protein
MFDTVALLPVIEMYPYSVAGEFFEFGAHGQCKGTCSKVPHGIVFAFLQER